MLEIQVLAWDRHSNVGGLNRLLGSLPSSVYFNQECFDGLSYIQNDCKNNPSYIMQLFLPTED
jgi:hypothetical protein